jgi:hypothetical protein
MVFILETIQTILISRHSARSFVRFVTRQLKHRSIKDRREICIMKKIEIEKSMEQMLKMLHAEWSRTGKTSAEIFLSKKDVEKMSSIITEATEILKSFVDNEEISFKENLHLQEVYHIIICKKLCRWS